MKLIKNISKDSLLFHFNESVQWKGYCLQKAETERNDLLLKNPLNRYVLLLLHSHSTDVPLESDRFDSKSLFLLFALGGSSAASQGLGFLVYEQGLQHAWGESRAEEVRLCFGKPLDWKCTASPWKISGFVDIVTVKVPSLCPNWICPYSLSLAWSPQLWSLFQSTPTPTLGLWIWLYHTSS